MSRLLICLLILLLCGCGSGIFGFEKSYRCEPFRWIGGEDGFYTDGIYTSNKDYFPNDIYVTADSEYGAMVACPSEYIESNPGIGKENQPEGCDCVEDMLGGIF